MVKEGSSHLPPEIYKYNSIEAPNREDTEGQDANGAGLEDLGNPMSQRVSLLEVQNNVELFEAEKVVQTRTSILDEEAIISQRYTSGNSETLVGILQKEYNEQTPDAKMDFLNSRINLSKSDLKDQWLIDIEETENGSSIT